MNMEIAILLLLGIVFILLGALIKIPAGSKPLLPETSIKNAALKAYSPKIPIIRLPDEDPCDKYWAVIAEVRNDTEMPYVEKVIETCDDDLDFAKRMAIIYNNKNSDFTRGVKIIQKRVDEEFC